MKMSRTPGAPVPSGLFKVCVRLFWGVCVKGETHLTLTSSRVRSRACDGGFGPGPLLEIQNPHFITPEITHTQTCLSKTGKNRQIAGFVDQNQR